MARLIDRLMVRLGKAQVTNWFITLGTLLFIVGLVVVLIEFLGRKAPWPPVADFRAELAQHEVAVGETLPVALSYRIERSHCLQTVHWEMWMAPGLWLDVAHERGPAQPQGPVVTITVLPIEEDVKPGRHALRVKMLFDCRSFIFFGGRQYHWEARGLGWFTVTEARPE